MLDENEEDEVTEVCGMLYDESAKCNKYMGNDGDYSVGGLRSCFALLLMPVTLTLATVV